jgi:hypothetical protein
LMTGCGVASGGCFSSNSDGCAAPKRFGSACPCAITLSHLYLTSASLRSGVAKTAGQVRSWMSAPRPGARGRLSRPPWNFGDDGAGVIFT